VERVIVHARGALITRRIELPPDVPTGAVELVVGGVTVQAVPGSLRAQVTGGRAVTSVRARLVLPEHPTSLGDVTARVRDLELEAESVARELTQVAWERDALARVAPDPGIARRWSRDSVEARIADARAIEGVLDGALARLDERKLELAQRLEDVRRTLDEARLRAATASTAERAGNALPLVEIVVRLDAATDGGLEGLSVSYSIDAARWWPAYTARLSDNASRAEIGLDAFVAQCSGEDWSRAKLALSTADLVHDARLPELRSLRMGRAQPSTKRGYRLPPEGLDAMFGALDRATRSLAPTPMVDMLSADEEAEEITGADGAVYASLDEAAAAAPTAGFGSVGAAMPMRSKSAIAVAGPMPKGAPSSMAAPAPMQQSRSRSEEMPKKRASMPGGGGGGAPPMEPAQEIVTAIEPADAWLDFDSLKLTEATSTGRGLLARATWGDRATHVARARAAIEAVAKPHVFAADPVDERGQFDHAYEAAGLVDIPSNAHAHRVSLGAATAACALRFVTVPREAEEVYREAEVESPFKTPLLGGPVDLFVDGALVTTSRLRKVDRGGRIQLGLGVEDRLRIARNARVDEASAGLLGGSTAIEHHVTFEVVSSLGAPTTVDVLDRVPITDDDDIDVRLLYARPEPRALTQEELGAPLRRGIAFRLNVPAAGRARAELGYKITLPAKNELIGGNRRE
jgi:hypothetical protein